MADPTLEDFFDAPAAPTPVAKRPRDESWIVTPEVQAERDLAAGRIIRSELGSEEALRERIKLLDKGMKVANPDLKGILADQKRLHEAGLKVRDTPPADARLEDFFDKPPEVPRAPRSDASIALGGVGAAALAVANEAAVVGDMFISNLPGAVVGSVGAELERIRRTLKGAPRSEVAKAAYSEQVRLTEKFSPNVFKRFVGMFAPEGEEPAPGVTEKAMNYVMELSDRDAAAIEERTGGLMKKEEVQSLRDSFLTFFGAYALKGPAKTLSAKIAKPAEGKKTFAVDEAGPAPEAELPQMPAPTVRALSPGEMAAKQQAETAAAKAKRGDVRAAIAEDPAWADQLEAIAERAAREREAARLEQERLAISEAAPRTRPNYTTEAAERPQNLETQLRPYQNLRLSETPALDSGLQKVAKGQAFALTAEELAAIRTSKSVWNRPEIAKGRIDNDLLAAIALGTTGAALAYMYPDETGKGAGLLAAGLLATPARGRLSYDRLMSMSEDLTLGSILKESPYTLKTLELPELQNRTEIPKSMIEQALKREGVTKAERDLLEGVLAEFEGATVNARNLVASIKLRTGDLELRPEDVAGYADYGLEEIGRGTERGSWEPDVPGEGLLRERIAQVERELTQPGIAEHSRNYLTDELRDYQNQLALRLDWEKSQRENPVPPATRTNWNYPPALNISPLVEAIENVPGGHVYGQQALGHTRAFEEGGTRHVVEVQSNLAQYIGKAEKQLAQPEFTAAVLSAEHGSRRLFQFADRLESGDLKLDEAFSERLRNHMDALASRELSDYADRVGYQDESISLLAYEPTDFTPAEAAEILRNEANFLGKFAAKSEINPNSPFARTLRKVEPTLKDWHKRLIREELAAGAQRVGDMQKYITSREMDAKNTLRDIADNPVLSAEDKAYLQKLAEGYMEDALAMRAKLPAAGKIRFATADTVAKVEGWSERFGPNELRIERENLRRMDPDGTSNHPVVLEVRQRVAEIERRLSTGQRFAPEHQGIYDRYRKDVEKFLKQLGAKPYTDSLGHTWLEVPVDPSPKGKRVQMFGKIDEKLQAAIAAAGVGGLVGAYLTDDKAIGPAAGALVGALGVLAGSRYPSIREAAKTAIDRTDYTLGAISTRVYNEWPALHRRLLDFELRSLAEGHRKLQVAHDFVKAARKLRGDERDAFKRAALTNDPAIIAKTLAQIDSPELTRGWNAVRALLDQEGATLEGMGLLKSLRENYFPRRVKDKAGLFEKLGKEERTELESRLAKAERASIKQNGRGLTDLESSMIINEYMATTAPSGSRPGFLKKRTIGEITKELAPFYEDPEVTLVSYLRQASEQIEKGLFFGKHLKKMDAEGHPIVDLDASIGELVQEGMAKGELTPEGADTIRSILNSRFGPGEASSAGIIQDFRNAAYTGLLGNYISSAVQLSDIGVNIALRGLAPTLEAVGRKLTGTQQISVRDLGLLDHVAEEFAGQRPSAKMLRTVFKAAGFTHLDAFSKDVAGNSALIHRRNQLKSAKGEARFDADLARSYGEDLPQLKADLRAKRRSDLTDSLVFAEISRTQPISRSEVPQAYLDSPNWRTLYMLKTYSLKQADLIRRESYNEIRKENPKKGLTNLAKVGMAFMLAGATSQWVTDWMSGRGFSPEWEDLPAGFFKTFGLSQYFADTLEKDGPWAAAGTVVLPPGKIIDDIWRGKEKAIRYIPLGGRLAYEHNFGGAESFKAREVLKRREAERNAGLSDDEKKQRAERLKQRAEARRRRLAQEY